MTIRIGTRSSPLATWQANWVADCLQANGITATIVFIKTTGDLEQSAPIEQIGTQGVFTKEIQRALLRQEVDLAVHSLKDLPTEETPGLQLGAVPKRGPVHDVLVSNREELLEKMPEGAIIGTGSIRRRTQLLNAFGDRFDIRDIRGNVETRLKKLDSGEYDAILLAEAGLMRLGLANRVHAQKRLPLDQFLPAVGQGALGLEIRENDIITAEAVAPLNDLTTFLSVLAERSFLRTMQGGCSAPIAALGQMDNGALTLQGRILSLDGIQKHEFTMSRLCPDTETANSLGHALAKLLLQH